MAPTPHGCVGPPDAATMGVPKKPPGAYSIRENVPSARELPAHMKTLPRIVLLALIGLAPFSGKVQAQRVAKYGADFLAGGVGARALAMGGAHVGLTSDVHSVYWNPAGLQAMQSAEVAYMHAERFSGIVSFDYAAVALPLSSRSTVAIAYFRSGVNDIKNTLDAWDRENDQPRPNPDQYVTTFSAADHALFVGYSRALSGGFDLGVTAKIIRRKIGAFAGAWGYSFDVGIRYVRGPLMLGAVVQDATTMLQSWSVDSDRLAPIRDVFGDDLPSGGTELVLPVLKLGSAYGWSVPGGGLEVALDLDLSFDGQSANVIDIGNGAVAFHPRFGFEYLFRDVVALRGGVSRVLSTERDGIDFNPAVGSGLRLGRFAVDYGFGDFSGLVAELGYSHRVSVVFDLGRERPDTP